MSRGAPIPLILGLVVLPLAGCGGPRSEGDTVYMPSGGSSLSDDDDAPSDDDDDWLTSEGGGTLAPTNADDDWGEEGDVSSGTTTAADDGRPSDDGRPGESGDGSASGSGDDGGPPGVDCPENCYCEPIDPDADVSSFESGFNGGNWAETYFGVLAARWPAGHDLLVEEQDDPYFGQFSDTSSFEGLMDSIMTEVHEGTHGWDYGHASVDDFSYFLRGDLKFYPPKIHGFDRGEIHGMVEGTSTDLYQGTYLTGTQGTYGFYELLDEGNCYINGMAAIAVVGEYIPWGISGRDGAVAFIYYLELYLKRARTQHPDVYAQLKADPDYVQLVQTQWLRLHFMLEYADAHGHLGINDGEIRQLMYRDENQSEIEMFIDHELEASNCLP